MDATIQRYQHSRESLSWSLGVSQITVGWLGGALATVAWAVRVPNIWPLLLALPSLALIVSGVGRLVYGPMALERGDE